MYKQLRILSYLLLILSDAERRGHILLLQIPHEGTAMDLVANQILYYVQSMEFKAWIYRVYALCDQLRWRNEGITRRIGRLR